MERKKRKLPPSTEQARRPHPVPNDEDVRPGTDRAGSVNLAERLVEEGLTIGTTLLKAFLYKKRSEKITIGNLPIAIRDEDVVAALRPYCRMVSLNHEAVTSGGYTGTIGSREAFVLLNERLKLHQLPAKLVIVSKGESTPAYITYGIECSKCHRKGHGRAFCPLKGHGSRPPHLQDTRTRGSDTIQKTPLVLSSPAAANCSVPQQMTPSAEPSVLVPSLPAPSSTAAVPTEVFTKETHSKNAITIQFTTPKLQEKQLLQTTLQQVEELFESLNANTILEPLYEGFYRREIESAVVFPSNREDILEFLSTVQSSALKEFLDMAIAHVGDKDSDLGKMLSDFRAECDIERDDTQWDLSDTDNLYWSCRAVRPLLREVFGSCEVPMDLQAWLFGVGRHPEAVKLTSVAKATIYKYHLGLEPRRGRRTGWDVRTRVWTDAWKVPGPVGGGLAFPAEGVEGRHGEADAASLSVVPARRPEGVSRRGLTKDTWLILPVVICLSQRLSHACLSTRPSKAKPQMVGSFFVQHLSRTPSMFSGETSEDPHSWIKRYERVARHNHWDESLRLANSYFYLAGTALRWYENNEERINTWEEFTAQLENVFGVKKYIWLQAKKKLKTRAQLKGESTEFYIQDVLSLCKEIDPQISKENKIAHFMKGIAEELYQALLSRDINNTEQFLTECRCVETLHRKRVTPTRYERLPNVASLSDQDDSADPSSMIRQIVREEVQRALASPREEPEMAAIEHMESQSVSTADALATSCATAVTGGENMKKDKIGITNREIGKSLEHSIILGAAKSQTTTCQEKIYAATEATLLTLAEKDNIRLLIEDPASRLAVPLSKAIIDSADDTLFLEKCIFGDTPKNSSPLYSELEYRIEPASIQLIEITSRDIPHDAIVVAECRKELLLERELTAPSSVISPTSNRGKLWVVNWSPNPKLITQGMHVADSVVIGDSQLCTLSDCNQVETEAKHSEDPKISEFFIDDSLEESQKEKLRNLERQIIQDEVNKMEKLDIIQSSESPWASPVVLIRKKDGSWRFCLDYCRLNKITKKNVYPLPRIDDTLDCLRGAKFYSSMDLQSGYWKIDVEESDREKTAFKTPDGLYEFKVMPFGLCNAPATFERMIDNLLKGLKKPDYVLIQRNESLVHKLSRSLAMRLERWALRLQEFEVTVMYKSGRKHQDTDCLSRSPLSCSEDIEEDIPSLMALQNFGQEQMKDPDLMKIADKMQQETSNKSFRKIDNTLYKKKYYPMRRVWLLVVPRHLRQELLENFHDSPTAGHLGFTKTYDRIRNSITGPECIEWLEGYLQPIPVPEVAFEKAGMDLLGRFQTSEGGNRWIIVCTDYLAKYAITNALPTSESMEDAKFFIEDVSIKHGAPRELKKITGRVRNFTSSMISHLNNYCRISHRKTTAYHPQANRLTERLNKTIADMLSMYVNVNQKDWDRILSFVTFAYNTEKQESTGFTPFFLVHGREAETPLDVLFPKSLPEDNDFIQTLGARAEEARNLARIPSMRSQESNKHCYDVHHRNIIYKPGDILWIFIPVQDQEDHLEKDPENDSPSVQEEDIPTERTQQPQTREEISGPITRCASGVANVLVGHPFDTIKVRLQTKDSNNLKYRGAMHCLWSTVKKESPAALYKGLSSPLACTAALNAMTFGPHSAISRLSTDPNSYLTQAVAGAATGGLQSVICSPMELVKSRVQVQTGKNNLYTGSFDCLKKIVRSHGIRGIYLGFDATLIRIIPGLSVYFTSYAIMKDAAVERGMEPNLATLLSGGLAGTFCWVVSYPADVVKSRIQCDNLGSSRNYKGIIDCVVKSYRAEGMECFYRGLNVTVMRGFITNAVVFLAYSKALSALKKLKDNSV
ncbi:SLC25A29 [Cordylochernes scorpioides]|uniref:RNA-directed DNA polymerase n=1 Tax=Cordylochernes scorpioides TaxID=51811 RepID=A0ABY6LJY0_9ARAC|nr:SLC25A29 [Cordylochernes scorpioides]